MKRQHVIDAVDEAFDGFDQRSIERNVEILQRRLQQPLSEERMRATVSDSLEVLNTMNERMRQDRTAMMSRIQELERVTGTADSSEKFYAIVRGEWNPEVKAFFRGVVDDKAEFERLTRGVWKPITKVFHSREEAIKYVEDKWTEAEAEGLKQVHNGVFSQRWHRIDDHRQRQYTITPDTEESNRFVEGHAERKRKVYKSVPAAHEGEGLAYELVDEFQDWVIDRDGESDE